ncbi:MAG: hypothetical protein MJ002_06790 [Paludibacteraceae bacterium]|nr:hypothetical protein [Paludibacteraceae bacterium]
MLKKLPKISLIVCAAISLIVVVMFFLGLGNPNAEFQSPNTGEYLTNSTYTDLFLWWAYILFGIAFVVTILFTIVRFCKLFAENPKKAIRMLVVLVVFALIFVISWSLGSDEKLEIIGYDGTDNVGFWAQFSDMIIFTAYTLFCASFLALFGSMLYSKLKK